MQLLLIALGAVCLFSGCATGQDDLADIIELGHDNATVRNAPTWFVAYADGEELLNLAMNDKLNITLTIRHIDPLSWGTDYVFHVLADDPDVIHIEHTTVRAQDIGNASTWTGNVSIAALFLGHTHLRVELQRPRFVLERSQETLDVIVIRHEGTLDNVFKISVACFVMVLYVNFGAALELDALKQILLRPVGPAIGFVGQFVVMPVLSFLIGYVIFHDMIELRLGLFFLGSTPGGGASNIFTVILNGNLNLSITMTALSNLFAFGMMPLWIFTLGSLIFRDGNFAIPYQSIATMSCSLVLPLALGVALQKYMPLVSKRMVQLIKPISLVLIIVIMIFAFTVNSYIYRLFSWKIIVATSALPWIGYIIGWLLAIALRQSPTDAITIAIETGIQNTGIAIFMLNFTLPQPQADMTSAVPVANSLMTPLPLLLIYVIRRCFGPTASSIEQTEPAPGKTAKVTEVEAIVTRK